MSETSDNKTISYFGFEIVEKAVAHYFATHGVNEEVRDRLMEMESNDEEEFFDMVESFVENNTQITSEGN